MTMTLQSPAVSTVTVQGLRKIVPPKGESPDELHALQIQVQESRTISAIWDEINRQSISTHRVPISDSQA